MGIFDKNNISSRKKRLKYIPCDTAIRVCKINFKINLNCFKIFPAITIKWGDFGLLGDFRQIGPNKN